MSRRVRYPPAERGSRAVVALGLALAALLTAFPRFAAGDAPATPAWEPSSPRDEGIPALPPASLADPLTIVWCDVENRLPDGFADMSVLVSDLFLSAGLRVAWRQGCASPAIVPPSGIEVPVVLLARDRGPRSGRRNTLGATWRGAAPRPVWIYLDAIWWTLGRGRLPQRLDGSDGRGLAIPLARVVAHELIHALAPEQDHEERGLMKETFSRADLLEPLTRVDAPHLALLLDGLRPLARRSERRTPPGHPVL